MFRSMRKFTLLGFVMMTLGVIPVSIPYSDGASNHTYGDESEMTDAEYEEWMRRYSQPIPPTPTSPDPEMTDAEYEEWMRRYSQPLTQTP